MTTPEKIIAFIETLLTPDGAGVGTPFVLREWQKEIIRSVYGPEDENGLRIVRQAVLTMGRKNGKTALVAGLCLAHLCGPVAIKNGQLYSVAFDREQAAVLFKLMSAMIYMDEELSARLNIIESRKKLVDPVSGSEFTALSSETKGKHGKSSSFIVFDELAQFGADRELYDVMMTSRGAHAAPLVWCISTQAASDAAVLSELVDYGAKINQGEIEDSKFKAFIYTVPKEADPWDENLWSLANPALGDFRSLEEMRETADKAKRMPSSEAAFRNLYLNQRVDGQAHFITPAVWQANGEAPDMEVFASSPVFGGLDLSMKNDLTALVLVTRDEAHVWHVLPYFWKPKDLISDHAARDRAPYDVWARTGMLETSPGSTIDYRVVTEKIMQLREEMRIERIFFDRWNMQSMVRAFDDLGVPVLCLKKEDAVPEDEGTLKLVEHGQGFKDMSQAVTVLEDMLLNKKLRHGMHPILTMCSSNARIQIDPAENRKFDKNKSTGRIDGIVALAMALNGAVTVQPVADPLFFAEVW